MSIYYFPTDEDEEAPKFRDRMIEMAHNGVETFCVWDCCRPWVKFQKVLSLIVFDPFVELFITLCIVVNTLFMALDHHGIKADLNAALKNGNYVRLHFFNIKLQITSTISLTTSKYNKFNII